MGIPRGTIEPHESPEEALVRELKEELSVEARIIKKAGVWTHTTPSLQVEIHGFIVETNQLDDLQLSVHSEMKWISSSDGLNLDWLEADIPIVDDLLKGRYAKDVDASPCSSIAASSCNCRGTFCRPELAVAFNPIGQTHAFKLNFKTTS